MKKVLAGILSAILGVFGVVAVDQTIETRVSTLEVEVSELREQVSAQSNEKTFKVGDEIKSPQKNPVTIKTTYSYGVYDSESGDTIFKEEDVVIAISDASAVITDIEDDESLYAYYRNPYTVCAKVSGQVDSKYAGKKLYFNTSIKDLDARLYDPVFPATIAEDGTFSFENSDIETSAEYLDALFVLDAIISN